MIKAIILLDELPGGYALALDHFLHVTQLRHHKTIQAPVRRVQQRYPLVPLGYILRSKQQIVS